MKRLRNRRAQLYSQIFIYVLTIILVSFILFYGYNAVQNFKKRAEQVACLKFRNDLSNSVESISSDFGSVKRKDLQLCAGYTQVCFVETFESPNLPYNIDPIIKDSILSNTGKNVFLVEKTAKESFYAGKISVEPDVLCIKAVNNKISIRLEGRGSHALLSEWAFGESSNIGAKATSQTSVTILENIEEELEDELEDLNSILSDIEQI